MDVTAREEMYKTIQTTIMEDLPIMPLYYDKVFVGASKNVQNFAPDIMECHNFSRTYVQE
jgi:ABC-type transport system substrate-binding protein